ncbi:MAG: hypothetical protein JWR69_4263 [Pedosphaera sp.]|nr:hypothetical protein [Pedosphaera sp.]
MRRKASALSGFETEEIVKNGWDGALAPGVPSLKQGVNENGQRTPTARGYARPTSCEPSPQSWIVSGEEKEAKKRWSGR